MKGLADLVSAYRSALRRACDEETPAADAAHERAMLDLVNGACAAFPNNVEQGGGGPADPPPPKPRRASSSCPSPVVGSGRPAPSKPREAWRTSAQQERDAAPQPAPVATAPAAASPDGPRKEPREGTLNQLVLTLLREDGGAWTAREVMDALKRGGVPNALQKICVALADLAAGGLCKKDQLAQARDGARFEYRAIAALATK